MILQLKYMLIVMNPARIEWLEILQMLWFVIRLIFKTSSVTPDFFYVFNLILSFSTCSESFEKICAWELLGAIVLNTQRISREFEFIQFVHTVRNIPNRICKTASKFDKEILRIIGRRIVYVLKYAKCGYFTLSLCELL